MLNRLLPLFLLSLPLHLAAAQPASDTTPLTCHVKWAQKDGKRVTVDNKQVMQVTDTGDQLQVGNVRYMQTLTKANRRYFSSPDRLLHACVIDEDGGQSKVILRISGTATTMVMGCQAPLVAASNP
ncbi:hypothetical protein SAMN05443662_1550 [Sulfurivirga caldicuralii]|uniref:Uncharacterized protein n=1 Tax=Sulfurivirga caldicuralii TaxID=364032 RepID=A0A1N6GXV8_9GAMM|nr:hypothetical protein [Sulfurivirga caldicuralii]SIO12282.1 hypothetical protein SAMN05443662_1550 [Sulfurivirga caldicuralii]